MKNHFTIQLKQDVAYTLPKNIINWQDFIEDKSSGNVKFTSEIDSLLNQYNLPYWVTLEYRPKNETWSQDEINSGLNRIFRIILKHNTILPKSLLVKIKLLPYVEEVREMKVGKTEIPSVQSMSIPFGRNPGELIHLDYAHNIIKGLPDVKIAILDTGVDSNHPELKGKIIDEFDTVEIKGLDTTDFVGDITEADDIAEDYVGHGSHVAGIICGKGIKINEGVAPNCGILAVRVLAAMKSGNKLIGAGLIDNINNGIKWAVDNGADVINMSLGVKHAGGGLPHKELIDYAINKGVTIVAASGNDGTDEKYYPGALPNVFAVGAVDYSGNVTGFSSYGANITVVAPGMDIYSSYASGKYAFSSGTSQASPFVAGSIALLKSYAQKRGKALSNEIIHHILQNTSDRLNSRWKDIKSGYGLINLADAFKFLDRVV